jgi:hypothetical protein
MDRRLGRRDHAEPRTATQIAAWVLMKRFKVTDCSCDLLRAGRYGDRDFAHLEEGLTVYRLTTVVPGGVHVGADGVFGQADLSRAVLGVVARNAFVYSWFVYEFAKLANSSASRS